MKMARWVALMVALPVLFSVVRCVQTGTSEEQEEAAGAYLGSLVVKPEGSLEGDCLDPQFQQQTMAYSAQVELARQGDSVVADLVPAEDSDGISWRLASSPAEHPLIPDKGDWPPITIRETLPWMDTLFITVTSGADPAAVTVYSVAIEASIP